MATRNIGSSQFTIETSLHVVSHCQSSSPLSMPLWALRPPNTIKIYCDTRTIFKYLVAQSHLFLNFPLCAACFQQGCAVFIQPKLGFQIIISMIGSKPSLRLIVLLQWCSKLSKYVHVSRYGFYIHVAPVQPHQLLPSSDTHLLTQHCALRSTSLQVMGVSHSVSLSLSLS